MFSINIAKTQSDLNYQNILRTQRVLAKRKKEKEKEKEKRRGVEEVEIN